jgi:hypothetical protein
MSCIAHNPKQFLRLFQCDVCGVKRVVPKKRRTAVGHTKHFYCYVCKDVTPHTQLTEE